jgi:hypothetical protein
MLKDEIRKNNPISFYFFLKNSSELESTNQTLNTSYARHRIQ